MKRLKAFFGGLLTPTTSEFWLGWGSGVLKIACLVSAPVCQGIEAVATGVGFPNGDALIATLLAITAGRMTSKAAKVAVPAAPPTVTGG